MKINKFKTGDIITRIANANGDYSYTGDKLELIKIDTKYIYLKSFQEEDFPHEIIKLELKFWKNGWERYIDNDSSKLIKDIYDSGKELKLQYDKFSKEREENGPYKNFSDFCKTPKLYPSSCPMKQLTFVEYARRRNQACKGAFLIELPNRRTQKGVRHAS